MIEVNHLTKVYGDHTAVSDLSFSIDPGHIYGLLGPNGAGKTTTMNIMTGCLAATEGTVKVGGFDIFEEPSRAKALIGYLPEQPPLYMDMTPEEYLRFVAQAKGVTREGITKEVDRAMEVTQVTSMRERLIKNLSKGYRQRVGIAQALLGHPEAVILDEPTVGLDPIQIIEIRELIAELGREHTVILSSHILSEVRAVCGHIMIISHGKLVASDTPENLERLFTGSATLELSIQGWKDDIRETLSHVQGVHSVSFHQTDVEDAVGVSLSTEPGEETAREVFYAMAEARLPILRMDVKKASLEDVFIELTSQENDAALDSEDSKKAGEKTEEKAKRGGGGE